MASLTFYYYCAAVQRQTSPDHTMFLQLIALFASVPRRVLGHLLMLLPLALAGAPAHAAPDADTRAGQAVLTRAATLDLLKQGVLYRDDGRTYAYEKGDYQLTHLTWDEAKRQLTHTGAAAWTVPDQQIVEVVQ